MRTVPGALDAVTERFAQAWNERDVAALGEVFAEDADYVDPSGNLWHGRASITAEHRRLFRGPLAHSALRVRVAKVRMVSRSSALIYSLWSMTGHNGEPRHTLPLRTGFGLFAVVRANGVWSIIGAHITDSPV
jgi:uncharacterized protein (TIGR02246 family)